MTFFLAYALRFFLPFYLASILTCFLTFSLRCVRVQAWQKSRDPHLARKKHVSTFLQICYCVIWIATCGRYALCICTFQSFQNVTEVVVFLDATHMFSLAFTRQYPQWILTAPFKSKRPRTTQWPFKWRPHYWQTWTEHWHGSKTTLIKKWLGNKWK